MKEKKEQEQHKKLRDMRNKPVPTRRVRRRHAWCLAERRVQRLCETPVCYKNVTKVFQEHHKSDSTCCELCGWLEASPAHWKEAGGKQASYKEQAVDNERTKEGASLLAALCADAVLCVAALCGLLPSMLLSVLLPSVLLPSVLLSVCLPLLAAL